MKVEVTTEISFCSVIKAVETLSILEPSDGLISLKWYANQLEKSAKRIRKRIEKGAAKYGENIIN